MRKINGNVIYDPMVDYSDVEEITGSLNLRGASDVSMPVLTRVDGSLIVGKLCAKTVFCVEEGDDESD